MAISYPLRMPVKGVATTSFDLMMSDAVNELPGGTYATELSAPYWSIKITTATLQRRTQKYRDWAAFLMALRGAKKTALLFDADAPRPAEYIKTGLPTTGGFDGTGSVLTITNRRAITLEGLPIGLQLRAMDYVEIAQGGRHFLCQLQEDALASGGGTAAITFEPALPLLFTTDATYNLEKPCTEAILDGQPDKPREIEGGSISFTAKSRIF